MAATTRTPLNRNRIIEAAVAYADENGVDGLSMRKLGAELGVEAMSLYNHVENKDDIYDGMIDHVFGGIPIPGDEVGWKERVRRIAEATMSEFSRHPWIVHLCLTRGMYGPGALRFMDEVLGLLDDVGFDDEEAHHAWQMLTSHTLGYAIQYGTAARERDFAELEERLTSLTRELPNVARLAPLLIDCSWDDEYMFGLEIILDGLESRLNRP